MWVRGELEELERAVRWGKEMDVHYKTFVTILKDAIVKMGSYAPIEGADIDAVIKTVVDVNCTAWKKAMKGVKMGNSKTMLKIEEKREGVVRAMEDRDLPMDMEAMGVDVDAMEGKSEEEKKEIKRILSKFWNHVSKAHEEASCAVVELSRLAMVLEPEDHYKIVEAGTRPLIAMEIPKVQQLISEKKTSEEWVRSRDEKQNMRIEDIIIEQNLLTPLDRWKDSKVLLPTRYLAAAVHYFIYSQADQVRPLTNKFVAGKFRLSPSNLHRILTGRKYAGGHETAKGKCDEHGEKYVKVSKYPETKKEKSKGKSSKALRKDSGKVTVTKVPVKQKDVDVSSLGKPPAKGTRVAKRKKKDDDENE